MIIGFLVAKIKGKIMRVGDKGIWQELPRKITMKVKNSDAHSL